MRNEGCKDLKANLVYDNPLNFNDAKNRIYEIRMNNHMISPDVAQILMRRLKTTFRDLNLSMRDKSPNDDVIITAL
jgi:hypothetical protein